jgi:hypothetical protein
MSVGKFLQNSGLAALAAALVFTALPASAQDRGGRNQRERAEAERVAEEGRPANAMEARARIAQRGERREQRADRIDRRSEDRAQRIDRGSEQRARQIDRRTEQRADRVERRGDWRANEAARQGNWGQARRIDRNSEQAARQIERRGDQRADRVERRGDQRADRVERRGDWRADRVERGYGDRNRTYRDRDRNRSYDNRWRDSDRRWSSNDGDRRWRDNDRGDYRRWDRRWRDNNRYNWQGYRSRNRVVFNIGTYYSPYRNYRYRRLGIGGFLDSLFFSQSYWIHDPWQYRLPEVYGPYRWVRYYDDVLLVDVYSGEVVDVIYDFFW